MSIVVRRFFGPVVPIQPREDWKWSTRIPFEEREADAEPSEPAAEPPALDPPDAEAEETPLPPDAPPATDPPAVDPPEAAPLAVCAAFVAVCVTDEAVVCVWFVTLDTGGGGGGGFTGGGGGGGFGGVTGGTGTGRVTVGTVGVGKVGGGGSSIARAAATPATRVNPATRTPKISRIPEQLRSAPFGCGFRQIGNNQGRMPLAKRDYYEVLGISRDADGETIKRAFHELARDWHPDVANAPDAEARFRELAEAYSVLSRRESRLLYDRHGYRGRGNAGFNEMVHVDVARGENIHTDLELRSFEAEGGTRRIITFHAIVRCTVCDGRGCTECEGRGTVETERRLRLRIPPGLVDDGALLRVAGDGNDAGADSVPGDLLVRVRVLPPPTDPRFVRYIALTLLLLAIAGLALYVLR